MCGIVGYVGNQSTIDVLMGGLARMEYRGYDSAGVAIITDGDTLASSKRAGKLKVLADELARNPLPAGHTGIGHTRWATHGGPTDANAHPHLADGGKLALIHNGIIENFAPLKARLVDAGYEFASETDTEVAAILLGHEFQQDHDLRAALTRTVNQLEGAFTLLAVHVDEPGLVVAARRNSPLVIGLGEGENFLGSDVAAFVAHTRQALAIGQVEAFLDQPFGLEPRVEAEPFHQPDGDLFQHPGADAREDVIGRLALNHRAVDPFGPQQVAKEQARGPGTNDGNLGFHGTNLPIVMATGLTLPTPPNHGGLIHKLALFDQRGATSSVTGPSSPDPRSGASAR